MTESIGEKERVKKVVKEVLDVFSGTSLEYDCNRIIVAETIAKDLVDAERNYEKK